MKKIVYILALGAFGIITTEFGVIGILPQIAERFDISTSKAGWLLSAFALTVAISGTFITFVAAKMNRKTVLCLVLSIFILSNIVSALATNFTVLMIARIMPAILHALYWSVAITMATEQVAPKDAPKAVSIVFAGLSVATVLGIPITTYAADLFDWRASFLLAGLINSIALAALILFLPSMPVKKKVPAGEPLKVLRRPQLWLNFLSTSILMAGMFATYGYLAEYLKKIGHMNGVQISIMLLLFGGMGIIGNWLMGRALSWNIMRSSRIFYITLAAIHVLAYSFGGFFIPMIAIISIWGLVHTGGFMVGNVRSTNDVPRESLEFVNGILASFFNIGISVGTLLGGIVIARYGVHEVIWVSILLFLLVFAVSFISLDKKTSCIVKEAGKPGELLERA